MLIFFLGLKEPFRVSRRWIRGYAFGSEGGLRRVFKLSAGKPAGIGLELVWVSGLDFS